MALNAVAALVDEAGVGGRGLREVLADLAAGPRGLDDLIRRSAVPRRTVEALLRAAGPDVETGPRGLALRVDRVAAYRDRFRLAVLESTRLVGPVDGRLANFRDLVARLERDIAAAPRARDALDHVSATAETVVRRALWLDGRFDLAGRRVLCVGDHDLTSLALCAVNPEVAVTVIDIDDRVLEHVDRLATERGLDVRCRWADCRFGLPEDAVAWADLALTDPPYTPEGVGLFLARAAQGLRDRAQGRLVMAYGFSDRAPALGVRVQRAILDLELAFEAILPGFNRYQGAQALGSAGDLCVCRPTPRTWDVLERRLERAAVNIYSRGEQAREGEAPAWVAAGLDAAREAAGREAAGTDAREVDAGPLVTAGLRERPVAVAVDLSADPGPWLLRTLLAANADRLAALVPNTHPDLTSQAGQRGLSELVAAKWSLRFRRSTPEPGAAIVEAVAVPPDGLGAGARLVRRLLDRAHGKVGNVWREGLIDQSRQGGAVLTRNQARELVRGLTTRPDLLEARIVDLPRHLLRDLLAEVER